MATASGDYLSVQFSDELARIAYDQHPCFLPKKKPATTSTSKKTTVTATAATAIAIEKKKKKKRTSVPPNFSLDRRFRSASSYDAFADLRDGSAASGADAVDTHITNDSYDYSCGLSIRYPTERTFQYQQVERCVHEYVKIETKSMRRADEAVNVISQCKHCNKTIIQ